MKNVDSPQCGFFKRKRPNLNKEDGNDEEMEQFKREMLQEEGDPDETTDMPEKLDLKN